MPVDASTQPPRASQLGYSLAATERAPSFASWILVVFCPPIYFAVRKNWGAFLTNAFFAFVALVLVFSLFLAPIGVIIWVVCIAHAGWNLRGRLRDQFLRKQAEVLASALAAERRAG